MDFLFPENVPFSRDELFDMLHHAPFGMAISRPDGAIEYCNRSFAELLDYESSEIYALQHDLVREEDRDLDKQIHGQLLKQPDHPIVMEKHYVRRDGHILLCYVAMVALRNPDGRVDRILSQVMDISYRKRIEKSAELFRTMINASRDGMFIVDPVTGKIMDANIQACQKLEYSYEELLELYASDIQINIKAKKEWNEFVAKLRREKHTLYEGEHRTKSGKLVPVEVGVSYMMQSDTEYILAIVRDISERKKNEALIWQQANFDSLTKLPNRNMLYERLSQALKQADRSKTKIAIMCLDLDKFKEVNDTLGHDVGDKLLKEVGQRLSACTREVDTVARLGGDEFCVVIENVTNVAHVSRIASNILKAILEPIIIDVNRLFISTSIGISFYPDDAVSVDSLMKKSDQAMYFAKSDGRNCFEYFTETMQEKALARMQVSRDLYDALNKDEFFLEYQPIISLADGRIDKAEALLRWNHSERGLIGSAEFIEIAEENGTISRIGEWVFHEVLRAVTDWRNDWNPDFQVSVNASPLQFREGSHQIERWQQLIADRGISGSAILIEITEGLIMDTSPSVAQKLLLLRDAGIQVALDDFGTGYSSLAYLQKLDIDYLKIDRSFVENLHEGSNEEALCEAVIAMAHHLNLKVVAEGIETEQQYQFLKDAGCDYGQGYWFSKSIKEQDFVKMLQQQPWQSGQ